MIIGHLNYADEYNQLHPNMSIALKWIKENYLTVHMKKVKKVIILKDKVYANIETVSMKEPTEQLIEVHRDYIDIHVPVNETEQIGWENINKLSNPIMPYDKQADIEKFCQIPSTYVKIHPGYFCIMMPSDGHAPLIGNGTLQKICVKVKI